MVITKKDKDFYNTLNQFLEDSKYEGYPINDKTQLFRFITKEPGYPKMIELFSHMPEYPLKKFSREILLQFDTGASLSALLLDEDYYKLLLREREEIDGYSILNHKGLIVFKAKAWLDMKERVAKGERGLSKHIKNT